MIIASVSVTSPFNYSSISESFQRESFQIAKGVSTDGYIPTIVKISKRGIPISIRPQIWKQLLDVEISPREKAYVELLSENERSTHFLTDEMLRNDVKHTCDDENYFVFEEMMGSIMRAFSRDIWVLKNCAVKPVLLLGIDSSLCSFVIINLFFYPPRLPILDGETTPPYPPNGVVPFEGLSLLSAPICFIYHNLEDSYFVFRNLYTKFAFV